MMLRPARYTARWVLPVRSPPVSDGAVLVDEHGRIAAVGPDAGVPAPEGAARVDLGAAVLLPGLVNAHAHPELAGFRGLLEDLPFHEWIPTLNRIKRAVQDGPDYEAAGRWTCAEALAAGTTTLAATEDSGVALDALRDAGLRGVVYREVFGPAPEQAEQAIAQVRARVEDMRARETELVRVGISPHAPYTVSDRLYRLAADYARAEGLPVAAHIAEAGVERELVVHGRGHFADGLNRRGIETRRRARSPIALLDAAGLLALGPLLIHCVDVDAEDMRLIADAGATVAHCPVANARLGHGTAPVVEMLAAGATVGLGTDSVASNDRLDLLEEARIAQILQRARLHSPDALPADRLLRMATLDGARALGLDHRVGSLERGKDADLCAVSLAALHTTPAPDPLAALFHAARGSDVVLTAVRGRVLYRDGRVHGLDLSTLRERVEQASRRFAAARYAVP